MPILVPWGLNPEVTAAAVGDNLRKWNSPEQEARSRKGDRVQPSETYTCKMCDESFEVRSQKEIDAHLKDCKKSLIGNLEAKIRFEVKAEQEASLPGLIASLVAEEIAKLKTPKKAAIDSKGKKGKKAKEVTKEKEENSG